jgi:hypothetical protein
LRALFALALVIVFAKACDLILARRRGVVFLIALLAIVNAVALGCLAMTVASPMATACQKAGTAFAANIPGSLCANHFALPAAAGALAFILTLMFNAQDLARGANDKGFVAAGYIAERKRSNGL